MKLDNENMTYKGRDINILEYSDRVVVEDSSDYPEVWIRSIMDAKKLIEALQRLLCRMDEGGQ